MNEEEFFLRDLAKHCRPSWKLKIKFYWYKYIRRIDIIGFYAGIPIIRSRNLEEEVDEA